MNGASEDRSSQISFPVLGMEGAEFRKAVHELLDIVINYHESLKNEERCTIPDVKPGFMRERVQSEAPEHGEHYSKVFQDIENVIFDGAMHWQNGKNLAFFPAGCSYPGILGDILNNAVASIGFTWSSCPSMTELETVMMDWLAKAIDLPECFIHGGKGPGGGVIQGTACEATVMTLLSARTKMIKQEQSRDPKSTKHEITQRLVAYASKCSHSSVERAGLLSMVEMRLLDFDDDISLRGETLQMAIDEDRKNGKIPLYVCATLGTTSCCSFDILEEIGKVCEKEKLWLHVDAAYAGSALLCPEFRHLANGMQRATSFNFNPHKWMMVNFDCSALWVRNIQDITNTMKMTPVYLQHPNQDQTIDYMHWQIPLSRRFRSIKLWFLLRMIGLEGLRHYIRQGVKRGKYFEKLMRSDSRFQILFPVTVGLICFQLKSPNKSLKESNELTTKLHERMLQDRLFNFTASQINDAKFIRVSTGAALITNEILDKAWTALQEKASQLLKE